MASTVGGLFLQSAQRSPDQVALVEGETTVTYAEVAARAGGVAQGLVARGVRPGDRVAIALPNGWRYAVVYAGIQLAGAAAVLVNTRFTSAEISHVLTDSGASFVVVDDELGPGVPEDCPHLLVDEVLSAGEQVAGLPGLALPGSDVANILYTSGTTGRPKGAMQTHDNLLFNVATIERSFGIGGQDRTLVVAPMFHATGLNSQLLGFMAVGGTCVFQPQFKASEMLRALVDNRITFFAGVTAMIQLAMNDPGFREADLGLLRNVVFGGAPVAEAFLTTAAQALPAARFANVWGMTEATSIVTVALGRELLDRPWTVGRAVDGIEVAVAEGDELVPAGDDVLGELWVRGPAVTAGYWRQPQATAETFRSDAWLRTGDVGRVDRDGYVQVLDRLKDMIIRGGENIYSLEVENVLARLPAIAEVAVVGVPDEVFGERVRAVSVLRPGATLDLAGLRQWAAQELADYKLPVELVEVPALPRNANGKVLKAELARLPIHSAREHQGTP